MKYSWPYILVYSGFIPLETQGGTVVIVLMTLGIAAILVLCLS